MGRKTNGNGADLGSRLIALAEDADCRELALSLKDQSKGTPNVERLEAIVRLAKAMRQEGVIEGSEAFYVVAKPITAIAEDREISVGTPVLERISKQIEEIEKRHGLESGEFWSQGEGPEEYERLVRVYKNRLDQITAATFEEFGEPEMAAMYRHDREKFDRQYKDGRRRYQERKARH